jgi:hypothetical protein
VVTAEGRLLTANDSENQDLFWGIRGGSGNFGVATSLEFRLHEVGPVFGGAMFYPAAKAKEGPHFWRGFVEASPDELVTRGGSLSLPDGQRAFGVAACYCGPIAEGEKLLKPLRTLATPVADMLGPMSYIQIQSIFELFFPPGPHVTPNRTFFTA